MLTTSSSIDYANAWREVRAIVSRRRHRLLLGLGVLAINRLAGLVLPVSAGVLVDDVVGHQRHDLLLPLALAATAATLIEAATAFALAPVLAVAAQQAIAEMRRAVAAHVIRLPIATLDRTQTGILIARIMSDAEGVQHLVGTGLVTFLGALVSSGLGIGVLVFLNWRLTLLTLAIMAGFGAVMARIFVRLRPLFRERSEQNARVLGRLAQTLSGIRVVKTYTAERREDTVFTRGIHRLFRAVARTMMVNAAAGALATLVIGLLAILLMVVGGADVLAGRMTLGAFTMYTFFVAVVGAPLVQVAQLGSQITEALAGLDRLGELRRMATEELEPPHRASLPALRGDIVLRHVWFEYDRSVPVLKDISLHAAPGTTTAFVGASGSGKSTLLGLLMAFHQPTAGSLLVDGHDLAHLGLASYRRHIGVVLQESFLFDGTIAENLRYARPRASDEEVRAAARAAYCDEFIDAMAEGYETVVGERGVRLSSGQRQRLAIARAILVNPRLLMLDEATSSLDAHSEARIQEALRALRRGRTTFVIAHRLSTVRHADQICVLDHGRIVEQGTHASLHALGGAYRSLYEQQGERLAERFINPGEEYAREWGRP